ncbi:MAG: hypothetical protein ACLS8T_19715 [Anaerobutyricum sp.]
MEELMRRRREKQPLDAYSAGSTFKRPQKYSFCFDTGCWIDGDRGA